MGLIVVGVVGALLLGYTVGHTRIVSERTSSALLSAQLRDAEARIDELTAITVDAELAVSVNTSVAQALREELTAMHNSNAVLNEELTFYKSLMAPSSLAQGLQVAELVIEPTASANEFQYQLLLTQIAKRRSYISGSVRIDFIGQLSQAEDTEGVLSLTELADAPTYPLPFRFRYFQNIAGLIELPSSFTPQRVLVTAVQKGEPPMQASFEWLVDQTSGSVVQSVLE
jgi:hypothetical protein